MFCAYYTNSFILDYQGKTTRKEFFAVAISDFFIALKIISALYALSWPTHFHSIPILSKFLALIHMYRYVFYALGFLWFLVRHMALLALSVRRLRDADKNVNWVYVPFYRFYLFCLPSASKKELGVKKKN